jgi:4'-phosphopantetheinyl transferase EntD
MIESILPEPAMSCEMIGPEADVLSGSTHRSEDALFPAERAIVAGAVAKRRMEFAAGRACARAALARLGVQAQPILQGPRGNVRWPAHTMGSITHCEGYVAAAVARSADLRTLGIDAEPNLPLSHDVLDLVALPAEQKMCGRSSFTRGGVVVSAERLLFSAKESVYKAWFPLTGRWLGFEDAEIVLGDGTFRARLLVPSPEIGDRAFLAFDGRWTMRGGLILTAVAA